MMIHLWQSTVFALLAAALAFALRNHRAAVRYSIWLAASLKFLLPFALLVSAGRQVPAPVAPVTALTASPAIVTLDTIFTLPSSRQPEPRRDAVLYTVWALGSLLVLASWISRYRRIRTSPALEPGVFGIFRPKLILPAAIERRLTPEQLRAIVAHETCHIRRRDNLLAAIHMLVQALFWFHPLVWWIGARLVEERERACDEEVLRQGADPEAYATGILEVCKLYLESRLACVSGVTGADLERRIASILHPPLVRRLTLAQKTLLAIAAATVVAVPIFVGVVHAQPVAFEVASIKPADPNESNSNVRPLPGGGLRAVNVPLRMLIRVAYNLRDDQVAGGPAWTGSVTYNIDAKGGPEGPEQVRRKLQTLLADRFHLRTHEEKKEMPIYELVPARGGLKIHAAQREAGKGDNGFSWGRGRVVSRLAPLSDFAFLLSGVVGRPVEDRTGVPGGFDFTLAWTPESDPPGAPSQNPKEPVSDPNGPGIFTALQDQLGLRLSPARGPVSILVIESAEKPSEN
jgi:uncharacterized protein (TIGR03435 family)